MFFLRSQACKNHFSFKKAVLDTDTNTKAFIYTHSIWKKLHTHQWSGSEFYGAQSFLMFMELTDTADLHWDNASSQL